MKGDQFGMKISKNDNIFSIDNGHISYIFSVEKNRYLMHRYFGKYIREYAGSAKQIFSDRGFCSNPDPEDKRFSLDALPQEYPDMNQGDFRSPSYIIQSEDGDRVTRFFYKEYEIIPGKPDLEGLPSVYAEKEDEAETLCVILEDECLHVQIRIYYTIFRKFDAICRHVELENQGEQDIYIERLMSMSMDFAGDNYDLITMTGSHTSEKNIHRRAISGDSVVIESCRGSSSPQGSPCVILLDKESTESHGQVWGFNYVYSGDFQAVVQTGQYQTVRVQMGMNPKTFGWNLGKGQKFVSPETVMIYSDRGLNGMSQIFHDLYRKRLCRGKYGERVRPILLNSWEAFYFNINEDDCLSLAASAADLGVELFVVDDGWFVKRKTDRAALGDWTDDKEKFPGGIEALSEKIRAMGMGFGIWFEPEMVSPDSDLYRAHPEWIIRSRKYHPVLSRNQYVLDLSRPEVCEYIFSSVAKILIKTKAVYVKWDMNRHITDLGSAYLDSACQRELSHRYMLGLYSVLERLNQSFPDVLFEGCSSGGGRYDAGMLYYMPQTWASDNTDAVCRLKIQYGTSLLFPPVTMGAHVSDVPNHQVGRYTPLSTRFLAAMSGNLGYEMDMRKLTEAEKKEIKDQICFYKNIREAIQKGRLYRLINPQNGNEAAWNFISEDSMTVILCYFRVLADPLFLRRPVKLNGLEPDSVYRLEETGACYGGDELMYSGITCCPKQEDFSAQLHIFRKVK